MKAFYSILLLLFSSYALAQVGYRSPARTYINDKGEWNIFVEAEMKKSDPQLANKALYKLKNTLNAIKGKLPTHSLYKLQQLNIFLMWGDKSPKGGQKSGMRFVRKGEAKNRLHYDPKWEHSVVIYSAENLVYLTDMWARKAITHELAHAWHIMHWPDKHQAMLTPWQAAKDNGLYKNVKDYKHRIKKEAYALRNNLEYFAELSAIYFVGGDYYPFDKNRLAMYDPAGVQMVKKLWQVP